MCSIVRCIATPPLNGRTALVTGVAGLLLESTVSPYGFGGTRDRHGTLTSVDFAGTGAGTANPAFVAKLAAKDRSDEGDPVSPRQVMRTTYVADPSAFGADEDAVLETVLSTVVGENNYPGDATTTASWPGMGPGSRGVLNAMSPKYFRSPTTCWPWRPSRRWCGCTAAPTPSSATRCCSTSPSRQARSRAGVAG